MFLEFAAHASVAASFAAFEKREEISNVAKRYWDRIRNGTQIVLVLGPGGVGKTTLGRFVEDPDRKIVPQPYNESFGIEKVDVPGASAAQVMTAPGQERRLEASWDEIMAAVEKHKRIGLINVVANGFHSTSLNIQDLRKDIETSTQTKTRYFHECREKELNQLREIELKFKKINKPLWMVTLVTKQDLWWADKSNVRKHYENAEYSEILKRISDQHTASNFRHEFFSVAFYAQNLLLPGEEPLVETTKGYDDSLKFAHQYRFMELLDQLTQA